MIPTGGVFLRAGFFVAFFFEGLAAFLAGFFVVFLAGFFVAMTILLSPVLPAVSDEDRSFTFENEDRGMDGMVLPARCRSAR